MHDPKALVPALKRHRIISDGQEREIDIRPMDESSIVCREMYVPPLSPQHITRVNAGDPAQLQEGLT
jgi:hypothetical protein